MEFDFGRQSGAKDACRPIFYVEPVLDEAKTQEAGHPVFSEVEFVKIIIPGSRNERPIFRVNENHKKRWPEQYKAFKDGVEYKGDGMPLIEWPQLTKTMVVTLNAIGIESVEELAEANEEGLRKLGGMYLDMKYKAQDFLKNETASSREIKKLESQNLDLEKRIKELEAIMEKEHNAKSAKVRQKAKV
jgi:hypothetical protein